MKRPIDSANIDMRGRVRREVTTSAPNLTKVRIVGSIAGTGIDLDIALSGRELIDYAGITWSWAGKKSEDGRRLFAKHPHPRPLQRFLLFVIRQTSKDPRLAEKLVPFRYADGKPSKAGQGARRRALAHAS